MTEPLGDGLENAGSFGSHFGADAVTGQEDNLGVHDWRTFR